MTGVDLLITLMLQTCNPLPPVETKEAKYIQVQWYECPLLGDKAEFMVWYRLCSESERYAVAIRDMRSGRGFTLNRFREVEPNFVEVYATPAYLPLCMTEDKP